MVTMNILFLNWLTFAIAVSAFVFTNILTAPGQILHRLDDSLYRKLPEWLYKPLIGCELCVSGQWALWIYFYISFVHNEVNYFWWLHLWLIMQTIFMAKIIAYLYDKFLTTEK